MDNTLLTLPENPAAADTIQTLSVADLSIADPFVLEQIVTDLVEKQYCVLPAGLPALVQAELGAKLQVLNEEQFKQAQIGRGMEEQHNRFVRKNSVHWLSEDDLEVCAWFEWVTQLKLFLNKSLYLGLDSFESHLAMYEPGDFYRRHTDAFRGERNRVVSLISYLNEGWLPDQGGELVLYPEGLDSVKVTPEAGTIVVFLSEEMPHEVLTTLRTRCGIAGWFRVRSGNPLADHL